MMKIIMIVIVMVMIITIVILFKKVMCIVEVKKQKIETEEGQLINVAFPLSKMPIDYQLSLHINNLLKSYERTSDGIIKEFKTVLYNPAKLNDQLTGLRVRQIVAFYGVEKCREWFTLFYGWEFKAKGKQKVG